MAGRKGVVAVNYTFVIVSIILIVWVLLFIAGANDGSEE